ncbi:pyrimidine dimer DNA glycosylase/endonuclease V [Aestuariirhabdus sp. Z084]|uniref:pyrimidine dimer DNA glycosylase/endonuclease V n=1 Tax=Aestuariirhabdus haliotis TaxID=2918751 RepID=UPI00201B4612|nr:pyrimidine dimer DNA glycosylase/endonuclease V [Aestuariirhabdus haliotis]MCL6416805.1 pyrimidine dimer DNA glycosylase/endonuclease V [Aestuariirhabdus haliotis]MCL6420805.1 pyrimidine dimer DNA glycosylase/endonuclease V [Aestuariirhabdus haliotis]
MNIFILDDDIEKCAQYHCDQHVVKMILESVQLLCTALNKKGFTTPYKSTHAKHPCTLWVEESYDNFLWLKQLTLELNKEYRYRYDKQVDHKSIAVLSSLSPHRFPAIGLTPFAQAMPETYKVEGNAVLAYRKFYLGDKVRFAKWTKRSSPHWFSDQG